MQYVYNGDVSKVIEGGASVTIADVQYGSDWDKGTIPGMQAIVDVRPTGDFKEVNGSLQMVAGVPTIVYTTASYTQAEIDATAAAKAAADARSAIMQAIGALEVTVTARRMREAVTSDTGKSWLIAVSAAIAVEREKL